MLREATKDEVFTGDEEGKDAELAPGERVRPLFPIFSQTDSAGRPLAYLDSAASSQKLKTVIDRLGRYLSYEHANIHRGAYALSALATENYELTRQKVKDFINAPLLSGVIFTRGTTEAVNLVSYSLQNYFKRGDCILLSVLEHHSNIVPWQLLARRAELNLQYIDIKPNAALNLEDFRQKIKAGKPKLVAITHLANSFGTDVPVKIIAEEAHKMGAMVLVDAAQSVAHGPLDMQGIGCDFLAFSGHKMYGPTGVGVLACSAGALEKLEPFQGGGDMISAVTLEGSTWAEPPQKFEAGTPAIGEVIALSEAVNFLSELGRERIAAYEKALFEKAFELLRREPGVKVYGPATTGEKQASVISFTVENVHPHDLASVADSFNVQIRAGHHCAMPALKRLNLPSTARASIGVYSTVSDFEALVEAIRKVRKMFG